MPEYIFNGAGKSEIQILNAQNKRYFVNLNSFPPEWRKRAGVFEIGILVIWKLFRI